MNATKNFFHRPKTPTVPAQDLSLPDDTSLLNPVRKKPRSPSQVTRPTLSERISIFGLIKASQNDSLSQFPIGFPDSLASEESSLHSFATHESSKPYQQTMRIVECLHGRLMVSINDPIPVTWNGELCSVFEAFRDLLTENSRLRAENEQHDRDLKTARCALEDRVRDWEEEKRDYKKEMKRLETIIAYSDQGIEAVIKARQDSVLRTRKQKNTASDIELSTHSDEQRRPPYGSMAESWPDKTIPAILCAPVPSHQAKRSRPALHARGVTSTETERPARWSEDDIRSFCSYKSDGFSSTKAEANLRKRQRRFILPENESESEESLSRPSNDFQHTRARSPEPQLNSRGSSGVPDFKKSSASASIGNTLSNIIYRGHWKHQQQTDQISHGADIPIDVPKRAVRNNLPAANVQAKPQARDLRRPFSFYRGDELDFKGTTIAADSPQTLQRSASLSKASSRGSTPSAIITDSPLASSKRGSSLDATRPSQYGDMLERTSVDPSDVLVRGFSNSSAMTTIYKPTRDYEAVPVQKLESGTLSLNETAKLSTSSKQQPQHDTKSKLEEPMTQSRATPARLRSTHPARTETDGQGKENGVPTTAEPSLDLKEETSKQTRTKRKGRGRRKQ